MAYFNQKMKAEKANKIKTIFKKYGLKGSIGVRHHSTLYVTITSGDVDFISSYNRVGAGSPRNRGFGFAPVTDGYLQVNENWLESSFDGIALQCLQELEEVMNEGNFDNSDYMTDYFHVGWYVNINIGKWNKPYICNKPEGKSEQTSDVWEIVFNG